MNISDTFLKYLLCFSMFFLIKWISKQNWSNRLFDSKGVLSANTGNLIGLQLAGILWLGLVPVTFSKQSFQKLLFGEGSATASWFLFFTLLILLVAITGLKASRQVHISNKIIHILSKRFLANYFFVRISFLFAYELFFRGLLLFDCIKWFGVFPAVILTTALTVLIHVFGNKKEIWACIPYGIIACYCCISIQAVWPAIVLHLAVSLTYEISHVNLFFNRLKIIK